MSNDNYADITRQFACVECSTEFEVAEGDHDCPACGASFEGVRDGDTFEVWTGERAVASWELEIEWRCQFCGAFHDSRREHEAHVEAMHYAELLREADSS